MNQMGSILVVYGHFMPYSLVTGPKKQGFHQHLRVNQQYNQQCILTSVRWLSAELKIASGGE